MDFSIGQYGDRFKPAPGQKSHSYKEEALWRLPNGGWPPYLRRPAVVRRPAPLQSRGIAVYSKTWGDFFEWARSPVSFGAGVVIRLFFCAGLRWQSLRLQSDRLVLLTAAQVKEPQTR
jgi:hypothetical protein